MLLRRSPATAHAVVLAYATVCASRVSLIAVGVVLAEAAGCVLAGFLVTASAGAAGACAASDRVVVAEAAGSSVCDVLVGGLDWVRQNGSEWGDIPP